MKVTADALAELTAGMILVKQPVDANAAAIFNPAQTHLIFRYEVASVDRTSGLVQMVKPVDPQVLSRKGFFLGSLTKRIESLADENNWWIEAL